MAWVSQVGRVAKEAVGTTELRDNASTGLSTIHTRLPVMVFFGCFEGLCA